MSQAFHLNEAMIWTKGALNCFLAAKLDGQEYIGVYVASQVRLVRGHLDAAKSLPSPRLP
ncbi:hypothetical protein SJI00_21015 [Pseudomonas sp. RP23018S]|uniref:hypothetical protein n=1 Tax=Pseudomonas sp. RP23018S TaxID=3096037 RepID=UPI002ACAE65E|nr:hypothetical protein [Pseudomonas sp. RP23018S]MDZ5605258.1 hypothetical protein [Pseudomonas sp. RP23018S]